MDDNARSALEATAAELLSNSNVPPLPRIPYIPSTLDWQPSDPAPNFYDVAEALPSVVPLTDPAVVAAIREEMERASKWTDWPEYALYKPEHGHDWKVIPFCYTFPADDPSATVWVESAAKLCPFTSALLKRIPGIRTALFSRLGPGTSLTSHQGWAQLSNHVLRCHLGLVVPEGERVCGMCVDDEIAYHSPGQILCFDDSKIHSAFNHHATGTRTVLIFDVARPAGAAPGCATKGTTKELADFMAHFH